MRARRKLMTGVGSFVIAAALAAPSFAAKQAVSDEELDLVTAAGQPVVISSSGASSTVSFNSATTVALGILGTSQANLRALVLNNVAGENQVANGMNIQAGNANGQQTNTITQSWGAINDTQFATVAGVAGTAGTACAATALICRPGAAGAAAPGVVRVLSNMADQIVNSQATTGLSSVSYNPTTNIALSVGLDSTEGSQNSLIALVVNNVAGLNQIANGVNISSQSVNLGSPAGALTLGSGGNSATAGQTNTIEQYRGVARTRP